MKSYLNWSGGKDSAFALYNLRKAGQEVKLLLTSVNSAYNRISMHGVRRELLKQQALSIGLELEVLELPEMPGMADYEVLMNQKIDHLKNKGFTHSIFGDIFLEDLKVYRESQLSIFGIKALFPLWNLNTKFIIKEFLEAGFKAVIVCVNQELLDKSFCGRVIDKKFVDELPKNVDPCGENGEFHTFVFDGPIFKYPIEYSLGELKEKKYTAPKEKDSCFSKVEKTDYSFQFIDLLPINNC